MERARYEPLKYDLPSYPSGLSQDDEQPLKPLPAQDRGQQLSKRRPWKTTILSETFALLWIAPILALLILNFKGYIIGPTAWCPSRRCYAELFNLDTSATQEKLREFSKHDHDVLGALQLVAKALEVWFEVIASLLVYLVIMQIATKKEGLPIGYIMTPFEFSRLPALFDFLLWKIAPSIRGPRAKSAKPFRHRIYLLLLLVIFLCATCNLMGPSTAVLVLPTLQWIETAKFGNISYVDTNASDPPRPGNWFALAANCSQADVAARNYSCSASTLGATLDSWFESQVATSAGVGATQQGSLSFSINNTYDASSDKPTNAQYNNSLYWAPNRMLIAGLNVDFTAVEVISLGYDASYLTEQLNLSSTLADSYTEYNKSLQLSLQRNGPIFGSVINNWYGFNGTSAWTVDIEDNQQLRCYGNYSLASLDDTYSGNYTKCITVGSGWGSSNRMTNFTIAGAYDYSSKSLQSDVSVNVYASENAVFLANGTLPDWLNKACLANGTLPSNTDCDWKRLFASSEHTLVNRSTNVNTIEMQVQNGSTSAIFATDFVAYQSFTTYTLDASPLTNPLAFVQTQDIPDNGTSIPVDPAWTLAAWSTGAGAVELPARSVTRSANKLMQTLLKAAVMSTTARTTLLGGTEAFNLLYYVAIMPVSQTLSLIDFRTTTKAPAKRDDPEHPLLQHNARMNVWAFGISSRTAILGTIVVILGIIVTLVQFVLALSDRREFRSSTQLLIAALEHTPKDEFEGRQNEVAEGRVRFHIRDSTEKGSRLTFHHTGWS